MAGENEGRRYSNGGMLITREKSIVISMAYGSIVGAFLAPWQAPR